MKTLYVGILSACVAAILGGFVGYLYATGSFSKGERTVNPEALKHTTDEFRLAALAGNEKALGRDFHTSRQIGLVDAEWAEGRTGVSSRSDTTGAALDTLLSYVGTTERGDNRGPAVERFLAHVGLGPGYAYCAAAVSYCLDAPPDSMSPIMTRVRSATAQDFDTGISVDADVAMKMGIVPQGWIHVYQKGQGPYGHNGFVQHWRGQCGRTVEANTSKGAYGNQRDGQGIWERRRCYNPQSYFRLDAFTPVIYPQYDFSRRIGQESADHLQTDAIQQGHGFRRLSSAQPLESPTMVAPQWRYGPSFSKTQSQSSPPLSLLWGRTSVRAAISSPSRKSKRRKSVASNSFSSAPVR